MKNLCITQKRNASAYVHGMRKGNQRSLQRVLYDNLNYGQEKCNKGDVLIRTGTLINIPRGSEGVDVVDNDFQTQRTRDGGKDYEDNNLKLEQTKIISRLVP